jgi:hypothetical protein
MCCCDDELNTDGVQHSLAGGLAHHLQVNKSVITPSMHVQLASSITSKCIFISFISTTSNLILVNWCVEFRSVCHAIHLSS